MYNLDMPQGGRNGCERVYSEQLAEVICNRLAEGESLNAICQAEDFPSESTVREWALEDRQGFAAKYARARDIGLDVRAERILQIPQGVAPEDVPRARLQFDAERWYLSKLAPKRYGEMQLLKHADADGNVMRVEVSRVQARKPTVIDVTPQPSGANIAQLATPVLASGVSPLATGVPEGTRKTRKR